MAVSKWIKRSALALAALSFVFAFASCDLMAEKDKKEDIEIEGTWSSTAYGYTTTMTFDNDEYTSSTSDGTDTWAYACKIVDFDNDEFNAGDAGEGDCGYAVVKFTDHYDSSYIGKYTVLRWQNLSTNAGTTTVDTCEGYGTYFDSEDAAEDGTTDAAGYFGFYSSTTLQ